MENKITIEVSERTALTAHIAELQRTITKRNKRIEELEARLTGEGESEYLQRKEQRAYSAGYKAAASTLMEVSRKFHAILNNLNKETFQVYLEGDQIGWDKEKYENH